MRLYEESKQSTTVVKSGISVPVLLTIVFVVLQLCKVINWSWWWVLSPLWISAGIFVLILIVTFIIVAISNRNYQETL